MATIKGENLRVMVGDDTEHLQCIAASTNCVAHAAVEMAEDTTKDTTGDWQVQEPTGLTYDISTTALMRSGDTITSQVGGKTIADLEDIYEASNPVKWQIANVSGANQRTKGAVIASGSVIIATLTLNGPNRQNADYTANLNGYGAYTVGS